MPKFSEETLNSWRMPPSDHEENKLLNAQNQVKKAIKSDKVLQSLSIEVFGQGSYANDTNVRLNSDIDLNLMYYDEEYFDLPPGKNANDFGIVLSNKLSYSDYKNQVEIALVNEFGRASVLRENKCIKILPTPTRIQCDVVPTFQYKRFSEDGSSVVGIKFISDDYKTIKNFPKQHIKNAIIKNGETSKSYKRITRIFRKLRYSLNEKDIPYPQGITSYLLECLTWNVPDKIYQENHTWTDILKNSIIYLFSNTTSVDKCKEWGEVSELLYLYHEERKWSVKDVNDFMVILWNYLEFK